MGKIEFGLPGITDVFDELAHQMGAAAIGEPVMDGVSDSPIHAYQLTTKVKLEAFLTSAGWKAVAIPFAEPQALWSPAEFHIEDQFPQSGPEAISQPFTATPRLIVVHSTRSTRSDPAWTLEQELSATLNSYRTGGDNSSHCVIAGNGDVHWTVSLDRMAWGATYLNGIAYHIRGLPAHHEPRFHAAATPFYRVGYPKAGRYCSHPPGARSYGERTRAIWGMRIPSRASPTGRAIPGRCGIGTS